MQIGVTSVLSDVSCFNRQVAIVVEVLCKSNYILYVYNYL